jgi:hypothetical protein
LLLALGVVVGGCSSTPEKAPATLASWTFEGATHAVQSGIAGYAADFWVERGWDGDGIVIYLSDQDLTCAQFPSVVTDMFPPLPTELGAMIWLKFENTEPGSKLDHSSFDVIERLEGGGISGNGASTDAVEATITLFDPDGSARVTGEVVYDSRTTSASPEIVVDGTFDVPFCAAS